MNEINQNKVKESVDAQDFIQTLTKTIKTLEKTVSILTKKLNDAEKEIKALREENMDLKTKGINVSELTKENEMYKMKIAELEREINDYKRNQEIYEAEKASLKNDKGDVYVLKKIIGELESLDINLSEKVASATKASDIAPKKPPAKKIKEQEVEILKSTPGIRRKCPNCGNPNPASIHEQVDKTRIIMESPRMYGKKFICGECGTEWK